MFWAKMSSRLSCCCVLGASFGWVHCHCSMALCGLNESGTGGLALGHLRFGITNNSMRVFHRGWKERIGFSHSIDTYPVLSSFILSPVEKNSHLALFETHSRHLQSKSGFGPIQTISHLWTHEWSYCFDEQLVLQKIIFCLKHDCGLAGTELTSWIKDKQMNAEWLVIVIRNKYIYIK